MKRIGRTLSTIGAAGAAALVLTTFASKAAYAADQQHPYTATCSVDGKAQGLGQPPLSCILSPAPPPNSQTVIQSVDVSLNSFELSQGPGVPLYAFLNGYHAITPGHPEAVTYVPFTSTPANPNTLGSPAVTTVWVAHELTVINVDANRTIVCNAVELNLHPDAILTCTVSGYYTTADK